MSSLNYGSDLTKAYGSTTISLVKPNVSNITAKTTGGKRRQTYRKGGKKKKTDKRKKGGYKKRTEKKRNKN